MMRDLKYRELVRALRVESQSGATADTKHTRVRLGLYTMRDRARRYIVRLRVPGGIVTPDQLEGISAVVREESGMNEAHITTRQGFEIPDVKAHRIRRVLSRLNDACLTTEGTGGNGVRSVVCCPYSGAAADSIFDVTPYALAVDHFFRSAPEYRNLPRKIKMSFESCSADHVRTFSTDIGFRSRLFNGVKGFEIALGGGLGAVPVVGQPLESFTPTRSLFPTIAAILAVFNEHGNRTNRSRARLKWLIQEKGINWFRTQVFRERFALSKFPFPTVDDEFSPSAAAENWSSSGPNSTDPTYIRWCERSVQPERQAGRVTIRVFCPIGDLSPEQLDCLADIIRDFGISARLTIDQDVVLRGVALCAIKTIYQKLTLVNLAGCCAEGLPDVSRCGGAAVCVSGITNSESMAKAISLKMRKQFSDDPTVQDIRIRVSGCANSCGHHHSADIGLYGVPKRYFDQIAPHYSLMVRGIGKTNYYGSRVTDIPVPRVPDAVAALLDFYRSERLVNEEWVAFSSRVGIDRFRSVLKNFEMVDSPTSAPQYYRDLDSGAGFKVNVKAGECAF